MVGISELVAPLPPSVAAEIGDRWLQIQLLGQIDGIGRFTRGVATYPGLNDEVLFATRFELGRVFPEGGRDRVRIGGLSAAPEIPLSLELERLVVRHSAVVGSTGSGKTSAVATIPQAAATSGFPSANIIVIDPHGEYSSALSTIASVTTLAQGGANQIRVPYWAMPANNLLKILTGVETATLLNRFADLVVQARRAFVESTPWITMDPAIISADTPVPFDLNDVWFQLTFENAATYSEGKGNGSPMQTDSGDRRTLQPPRFENPSPNNTAPFKGLLYGVYSVYPDRMRLRMLDPQLAFLFSREDLMADADPLGPIVLEWLGGSRPISVIDLSGVPADAMDLSVGLILKLLFEVAVRSGPTTGIGRASPVLIVLEEAHRYLSEESSVAMARESVNRIAREGRKYGMGIMLVSQRPSELPDTALSQVGTVIALRLTNGTDQATVKKALPDSVVGLADVLPSLRTGEAIVSGEAVTLPARVLIDRPDPEPRADDPPLSAWRAARKEIDVAAAVAAWRGMGVDSQ